MGEGDPAGAEPERPALGRFVQPARARAELWRSLAGLGLAILLYLLLAVAALLGGIAGLGRDELLRPGGIEAMANTPPGLLVMLAQFAALWLALWIVLRVLHRRGLASLFGPEGRPGGRPFLAGLGLAAGFLAVSTLLSWPLAGAPVPNATGADWALRLPLALCLLFIQIGAEELLFRGYLLQQLAARFRGRWAWSVLPSVLFGALHWSPGTLGALAPLVVVTTGLTGMILAELTARSGSLGMALGLHFGINIGAVLLVGNPRHLGALALWQWPLADDRALLVPGAVDLGLVALMGLAGLWLTRPRRDAALTPR